MLEHNKVVHDSILSKEFLSQFKTKAYVSKFLNQLHNYWRRCLKVRRMGVMTELLIVILAVFSPICKVCHQLLLATLSLKNRIQI